MGRISSFHRWSSIENDHRKLFNFTSTKSRDFFIDLDRGIIYIKYVVSKVKNKSLAVYYSICRDYVLFFVAFYCGTDRGNSVRYSYEPPRIAVKLQLQKISPYSWGGLYKGVPAGPYSKLS